MVVVVGSVGFRRPLASHSPLTACVCVAILCVRYIRWGRHEGCGFVEGNVRQWSERYRCAVHNDYGCSFDNRMSAVCSLRAEVTVPLVRWGID